MSDDEEPHLVHHPYRVPGAEVPLDRDEVRVKFGSVERRGAWTVPQHLDVQLFMGNCELDFREARLQPGLTTIEVNIRMGNLEIFVPDSLGVELSVSSMAGNVQEHRESRGAIDPNKPKAGFRRSHRNSKGASR